MADLHNLLDEVDDALEEEQQPVVALDASEREEEEAWDDGDREQLDLPAALEEVEQQTIHGHFDEDVDKQEELDVEFDDEKRLQIEAECYSRLKRLWQQELACPELLPLDDDTLREITDELEKREQTIDDLGEQSGDIECLLGSVLKVDADRARFMLSDLLRARLWKIQQHPLHMRDLIDRMSEAEVSYSNCFSLELFASLDVHYNRISSAAISQGLRPAAGNSFAKKCPRSCQQRRPQNFGRSRNGGPTGFRPVRVCQGKGNLRNQEWHRRGTIHARTSGRDYVDYALQCGARSV